MAKTIRELIGDTIREFFRDHEVEKEVRRIARTVASGGGGTTPNLAQVLDQGNDADGAIITDLSPGINPTDATTLGQVQGLTTLFNVLDNSNDADGITIHNLPDPLGDQDVATKKYVDDHSGGGSSLNVAWTARVDISGDDGTGVIGDMTKPFATFQAALTAIEGAANPRAYIVVDSQADVDTSPTTSYSGQLWIIGRSMDQGILLTLTCTAGSTFIGLINCEIDQINCPNGQLTMQFLNGEVNQITCNGLFNSNFDFNSGTISGDITADGGITISNLNMWGTITSTTNDNISLIRIQPYVTDNWGQTPSVVSTTGIVQATFSVLNNVTCDTLDLYDSAVKGTNAANTTNVANTLLASAVPLLQDVLSSGNDAANQQINNLGYPGGPSDAANLQSVLDNTSGLIVCSSYTPTFNNKSNCTTITIPAGKLYYTRIHDGTSGNTRVIVHGRIAVIVTSANVDTSFSVASLPGGDAPANTGSVQGMLSGSGAYSVGGSILIANCPVMVSYNTGTGGATFGFHPTSSNPGFVEFIFAYDTTGV